MINSLNLVKICGLRDPENILDVAALNPNLMGFIYYRESKRYVGENFHLPAELKQSKIKKVAVFVNETTEQVEEIIHQQHFDYAQLHGRESPQYCLTLAKKGIRIIKAFGIHESFDWNAVHPYAGICDFFLLDTSTKNHGGSGQKFDWKTLDRYTGPVPFLLSGGIGPHDSTILQTIHHKQMKGIDINSQFETEPGLKDLGLLNDFLNQIK